MKRRQRQSKSELKVDGFPVQHSWRSNATAESNVCGRQERFPFSLSLNRCEDFRGRSGSFSFSAQLSGLLFKDIFTFIIPALLFDMASNAPELINDKDLKEVGEYVKQNGVSIKYWRLVEVKIGRMERRPCEHWNYW